MHLKSTPVSSNNSINTKHTQTSLTRTDQYDSKLSTVSQFEKNNHFVESLNCFLYIVSNFNIFFYYFFIFLFRPFFLLCSLQDTFSNLLTMFNSMFNSLQPAFDCSISYVPYRKCSENCKQRFKTRKQIMRKLL